LEDNPPAWVTWESTDIYLSKDFFNPVSSSSLSAFNRWITMDPITADGDTIASYEQVELVTLGFGLALRALWMAQFPENYTNVPTYMIDSPYPFSEHEQLTHKIQDLISGYAETYVPCRTLIIWQFINNLSSLQELDAAYPARKTHKDVVGETDTGGLKVNVEGKGKGRADGLGHRRCVLLRIA